MGSPPPPNYPPPAADAAVSADAGVSVPSTPAATICGFGIGLPKLHFGVSVNITIPGFPPPFPIPWLSFVLSCDPDAPIDCSGGLGFGGGRTPNAEPDPDLQEDLA